MCTCICGILYKVSSCTLLEPSTIFGWGVCPIVAVITAFALDLMLAMACLCYMEAN